MNLGNPENVFWDIDHTKLDENHKDISINWDTVSQNNTISNDEILTVIDTGGLQIRQLATIETKNK